MLTKIEPPRTKRELITDLERSQPKRIEVFEGVNLAKLPSRHDLQKPNLAIIVLRF